MNVIPTLTTARLCLRPLVIADAPTVQRLAGAHEVADTTLNIPHPYPDGIAEQWIGTRAEVAQNGADLTWAIADCADDTLYGAISLRSNLQNRHAELGYWIGLPYWGRGYATEAARAVVAYGFAKLPIQRVCARYYRRNPASGRVMQKLGMVYEGCQRRHLRKGERFEDVVHYGILREEWAAAAGN